MSSESGADKRVGLVYVRGVVDGMLAMREQIGFDKPDASQLAQIACTAAQMSVPPFLLAGRVEAACAPDPAHGDVGVKSLHDLPVFDLCCLIQKLWEIMDYMEGVLPPKAAPEGTDYGIVVQLVRRALHERYSLLQRGAALQLAQGWRRSLDTDARFGVRSRAKIEADRGLK